MFFSDVEFAAPATATTGVFLEKPATVVLNRAVARLKEPATVLRVLLEKLERTLLRYIAGFTKARNCAKTRLVRFTADNATLVHHQVALLKTAARVFCCAVKDLCARSNCLHFVSNGIEDFFLGRLAFDLLFLTE